MPKVVGLSPVCTSYVLCGKKCPPPLFLVNKLTVNCKIEKKAKLEHNNKGLDGFSTSHFNPEHHFDDWLPQYNWNNVEKEFELSLEK